MSTSWAKVQTRIHVSLSFFVDGFDSLWPHAYNSWLHPISSMHLSVGYEFSVYALAYYRAVATHKLSY